MRRTREPWTVSFERKALLDREGTELAGNTETLWLVHDGRNLGIWGAIARLILPGMNS